MTARQTLWAGALAASCGLALVPLPAMAHHGVSGQFDLEQKLTVTGVVNRVRFVNPHAYIYFEVTNDEGKVDQWRCELRSGSLLKRKGWTPDMFPIGSTITISGSPDRKDPQTCYTETITMEDGRVLNRYDAISESGQIVAAEREIEREDGTPNLAGNWSEPPADGPPIPYGVGPAPEYVLTQKGIDESDDYTPDQNPRFHCQPTNIILDYRFDQMVNKIEQSESEIVITYGFMDVVRTIHLGGSFPDTIEPSVTGYSIGEWQGDTLVVHTKGFAPGFLEAIGGLSTRSVRHSDQMEITERFYLDEAGTELTHEYTITDPVYLAEPYSHMQKSLLTSDPFIPYECDDLTVED